MKSNKIVPTSVSPERWDEITVGESYTCGTRNKEIFCWGKNNKFQLGINKTNIQEFPKQIGRSSGWEKIVGGFDFSYNQPTLCGLDSGINKCWGNNIGSVFFDENLYGSKVDLPISVPEINKFLVLSHGAEHSCGIASNKKLFCWGNNDFGQLGAGDFVNRPGPTQISNDDWVEVKVGNFHTCAIQINNSLWCWGANSDGQLGVGDTVSYVYPQKITTPALTWKSISLSDSSTCGITSADILYCWGGNKYKQLGTNDSSVNYLSPVLAGLPASGNLYWRSVLVGNFHSCGITTSSELYCWGWNIQGQLGIGTSVGSYNIAQRIGIASDWTAVTLTNDRTCGLRLGGFLFCWGQNSSGSLGIGEADVSVKQTAPIQVDSTGGWSQVLLIGGASLGIKNGQLFYWGDPQLQVSTRSYDSTLPIKLLKFQQ